MNVRLTSTPPAPTGRADTHGRMGVRSFLRTAVLALFAVAMLASNVFAAGSRTDLTPTQARQLARQTLLSIKPSLNESVGEVLPNSLDTLVRKGTITSLMAAKYRQVFIDGMAPAGMPDVAHALSLPKEQRNAYVLKRLQEKGQLNASEVKFFTNLKAVPAEQIRGALSTALESGTFGALGSSMLQVTLDLSSVDSNANLETCSIERADSAEAANGFWGWVKGLVENVAAGAGLGGLIGGFFGGIGGTVGSVIGGVAGGIIYIAETTGGNGFMPGPNGEGCETWPGGYPRF